MTQKQLQFVERIKNYFQNKNDIEYQAVMSKAQKDDNFEKMVQNMTLDRLTGANSLNKHNIQF